MSAVLLPILQAMDLLLQLIIFALFARILWSWVDQNPHDRSNRLKAILYDITDPILEPLRRVIPPLGMIDISPIFAFIAIRVLQDIVYSLIDGLGGIPYRGPF
jgi:YggT family protein